MQTTTETQALYQLQNQIVKNMRNASELLRWVVSHSRFSSTRSPVNTSIGKKVGGVRRYLHVPIQETYISLKMLLHEHEAVMSYVSVGLGRVEKVLSRAVTVGEIVRKGGVECCDGDTVISTFWHKYDRMDGGQSRMNLVAAEAQHHSKANESHEAPL
jgi:hypothetical protein